MRRREFIMLLGAAAVAVPHAASAQKPRTFRVGYLAVQNRPNLQASARPDFAREMEKLGYEENKNLIIEWRYAEWNSERLPALARDLERLKVEVIVATSALAVEAAQQTTTRIPIVMAVSNDPVRMGLVSSLARPGGNTTGLSSANDETLPKQLEFLGAMVPNLSRVGHLTNAAGARMQNASYSGAPDNLSAAAQKLGIMVQRMDVSEPADIERVFAEMTQQRMQAVVVASSYLFNAQRRKIARLAAKHNLASVSQRREFAEAGGLMSYGESRQEFVRRIAYFVDKILTGAMPADLPVELPTRFSLVINQRTAKSLGLAIPTQLHTIADEVIE
jgi:putative tryptophan/tyrosine transport system substrate-binding protein